MQLELFIPKKFRDINRRFFGGVRLILRPHGPHPARRRSGKARLIRYGAYQSSLSNEDVKMQSDLYHIPRRLVRDKNWGPIAQP